MQSTVSKLLDFINQSPTAAHAIEAARARLEEAGFTELKEAEAWALAPGGKYFMTRSLTSLMAFKLPQRGFRGFSVCAAHSD